MVEVSLHLLVVVVVVGGEAGDGELEQPLGTAPADEAAAAAAADLY